jgi:ABC-type nickel/cobalt efflux system permease component RcnA
VEFGQIAVLIIVFPLLSMIRGKFFDKISKFSNWILVAAGMILFVYQLNGYFTDHTHHNQLDPQESQKEHHMKLDTNSHDHNHDHDHSHGH